MTTSDDQLVHDPMITDSHVIVLLRRAPGGPPMSDPEVDELQAASLAHLTELGEAGDLVAAGVFSDQDDDPSLLGMCAFRRTAPIDEDPSRDLERVRAMIAENPAVAAHLLTAELMVFWSPVAQLAAAAPRSA